MFGWMFNADDFECELKKRREQTIDEIVEDFKFGSNRSVFDESIRIDTGLLDDIDYLGEIYNVSTKVLINALLTKSLSTVWETVRSGEILVDILRRLKSETDDELVVNTINDAVRRWKNFAIDITRGICAGKYQLHVYYYKENVLNAINKISRKIGVERAPLVRALIVLSLSECDKLGEGMKKVYKRISDEFYNKLNIIINEILVVNILTTKVSLKKIKTDEKLRKWLYNKLETLEKYNADYYNKITSVIGGDNDGGML